jgi:hypothetical protein
MISNSRPHVRAIIVFMCVKNVCACNKLHYGNDVTIILCNGLSDWISEYDAFHTSFNTEYHNQATVSCLNRALYAACQDHEIH